MRRQLPRVPSYYCGFQHPVFMKLTSCFLLGELSTSLDPLLLPLNRGRRLRLGNTPVKTENGAEVETAR